MRFYIKESRVNFFDEINKNKDFSVKSKKFIQVTKYETLSLHFFWTLKPIKNTKKYKKIFNLS